MKMHKFPVIAVFAINLFVTSCGEDGPNDNEKSKERNPTHANPSTAPAPAPAPQRDTPNQIPGGNNGAGTRSDYQPSTGPAGQTESGSSKLPGGTPPPPPQNPAPGNP